MKKSSLHPPPLQLQPMLPLHDGEDRISSAWLAFRVGWKLEVEQALESRRPVGSAVPPGGGNGSMSRGIGLMNATSKRHVCCAATCSLETPLMARARAASVQTTADRGTGILSLSPACFISSSQLRRAYPPIDGVCRILPPARFRLDGAVGNRHRLFAPQHAHITSLPDLHSVRGPRSAIVAPL